MPMSNVERLHQAGILNPDALSDDQKDFINQGLTTEEVEDLIKVGTKFRDYCKRANHSFGTFTWGI
jgi:hypothetical protein